MHVRDVMNPAVARVPADATFGEAARRLCQAGWSELAVTDGDDDTLVGVLAIGDLMRALLPDLDELARQGGSVEDTFDAFLAMGGSFADQPVTRLVITDPLVLSPDDRLLCAATTMLARNIHRLFVVDDGKVVGSIGRSDICRGALAR